MDDTLQFCSCLNFVHNIKIRITGATSGAAIALHVRSKLYKQVRKLAILEAPYSIDDQESKTASEYYGQLKKLLKEAGQTHGVSPKVLAPVLIEFFSD